jgi:sugar phosphate permease
MVWKHRYTVVGLLFVAWVVSYMDRMVMSVAIPYIAKDFDLSPVAMGGVMSAFFAGYALCQIPGGLLADKFGARRLMVIALVWWSAFTAITGAVGSLASMLVVRVLFGVGEGIFPGGSFKTLATWCPVKERTTANAFVTASNSLGPALAPLFVVAVMAQFGWRAVFYSLFVPGIIMAVLIWIYIKDSPEKSARVSPGELAEIKGAEPGPQVLGGKQATFKNIVKLPILWQCFFVWFAYDITMWGFMAWLPSYLVQQRGFSLVKMGITASLPFFVGAIGLVAGGYLSDKFFSGSRRIIFVISALLGCLLLYLTYTVTSPDLAVVYMTVNGFIFAFAVGAFWGIPMTVLPKEVMGASATTINFGGQIAGFISPLVMGFLVQKSGGTFGTAFTFLIAATLAAVVVALTIRERGFPAQPAKA